MKRTLESFVMMGLLFCTSCVGSAVGLKDTVLNGAELCMTFRVTDTQGVPVTNAQATAYFHFLNRDRSERRTFVTDTNGMCTVKGLCSLEMTGNFSKEGYYTSGFGHRVFTKTPDIKDGKWQPWNPIIEITLKEKRNPMPMYVKSLEVKIPESSEPVGYDFRIGDWVKPFGRGEMTDVEFFYTEDRNGRIEQTYNLHLQRRFSGDNDGARFQKNNMNSEFKSDYSVSDGNFLHQFDFKVEREKGVL